MCATWRVFSGVSGVTTVPLSLFTSQWNLLHYPSACGVGIVYQRSTSRMQVALVTGVQNLGLEGEIVSYSSTVTYCADLSRRMVPHELHCSLQPSRLRCVHGPGTTLCERSVEERGWWGRQAPSAVLWCTASKALTGKQPGKNGPGRSGVGEEETVTPFLRRQPLLGARSRRGAPFSHLCRLEGRGLFSSEVLALSPQKWVSNPV